MNAPNDNPKASGIGLIFGIVAGSIIGGVFDNIGLFIGLSVSFGLIGGAACAKISK